VTEGGSWSMADEMLSDRRRENSARRLAQAVGLKVSKAGRRDMNFPDFGRFSVWDAELGRAVSPTGEYFEHTLTLDELEDFLSEAVSKRCVRESMNEAINDL
jgi:hypothetical protein